MLPMSLLCIAWKNGLIYAQLSTLAWAACGMMHFRKMEALQRSFVASFVCVCVCVGGGGGGGI